MDCFWNCLNNCFGTILCCPCITCYCLFNCCFEEYQFFREVTNKVFCKNILTDDEIGKKWILTNNNTNWLSLSKENKDILEKNLFKNIYHQISENKINIEYLKKDIYGKEFLISQIRYYLKMALINKYTDFNNDSWNPNSKQFDIIKLKKGFITWNEPDICKIKANSFIDKFLYIDSLNAKYDIDTLKEDEYLTLKRKLYIDINSILDSDINFIPLIIKSNNYLKQLKENTENNIQIAKKRYPEN